MIESGGCLEINVPDEGKLTSGTISGRRTGSFEANKERCLEKLDLAFNWPHCSPKSRLWIRIGESRKSQRVSDTLVVLVRMVGTTRMFLEIFKLAKVA